MNNFIASKDVFEKAEFCNVLLISAPPLAWWPNFPQIKKIRNSLDEIRRKFLKWKFYFCTQKWVLFFIWIEHSVQGMLKLKTMLTLKQSFQPQHPLPPDIFFCLSIHRLIATPTHVPSHLKDCQNTGGRRDLHFKLRLGCITAHVELAHRDFETPCWQWGERASLFLGALLLDCTIQDPVGWDWLPFFQLYFGRFRMEKFYSTLTLMKEQNRDVCQVTYYNVCDTGDACKRRSYET